MDHTKCICIFKMNNYNEEGITLISQKTLCGVLKLWKTPIQQEEEEEKDSSFS